jgi:hypothetical protein
MKKGSKMSADAKKKIGIKIKARWDKARKQNAMHERAVAKEPDPKSIEEEYVPIVAGGRPLLKKMEEIEIEKLPTRFTTAEQVRGYILSQTDGGRTIIDTILIDFRSKKSPKTLKRDLAKMLLELITPEKGQSIEFGMASPDGQFIFKWQNEVESNA